MIDSNLCQDHKAEMHQAEDVRARAPLTAAADGIAAPGKLLLRAAGCSPAEQRFHAPHALLQHGGITLHLPLLLGLQHVGTAFTRSRVYQSSGSMPITVTTIYLIRGGDQPSRHMVVQGGTAPGCARAQEDWHCVQTQARYAASLAA